MNLTTTTVFPVDTASWNSPYHPAIQIVGWVVASLLSLETIIGNAMVIVAYQLERSISKQVSNLYILSLAVSDLVIGIEGIPLFTVYVINGDSWPLGPVACDTWLFLDYTLCLVSILTVLLITMDRYLSVCHTARYLKWQTPGKTKVFIFFSWVIPALVFGVMIYGWSFLSGEDSSEAHSNGECYAPFLANPYVNMTMYLVYYWTTLIAMLILYKGIHHAAKNLEKKAKAKEHRHIALLLTQRLGTQVGVALTLHNQRQQEMKNEVKDSGYHTNNHGTSDTVELSVPESKRESLLSTGKRESLTAGTSPARRNIHRKHSQQIIGNRYPTSPIAHRKRSSVKSIKTVPLREEDEDALRSTTPDHDRRFQDSGIYDFTTADSLSSIFYDSSFSSVLQLKDLPSRPTTAEAADDNATLLQHAPSKKHRRPSSRKMSRNRKQSFTSATDSFSRAFCEDGQDIVVVHSEQTHHHHRHASYPAQRVSWWKNPRQKISAWFDRLRTPSSRKSSRAHERVTSRTSSISSSDGSSFASPEHELHDARPEVRIIREESTNLSGNSAVSPSQGASFLSPTSGSARRLSWHGDIGAFTRNATEQVLTSLFKPISVVQGLTGRNRKQTKAERRAHKAFRTITFIVGLFAILWSPYYIVATVYGFCKGECIPAFLYNLSYYMCYLNSSGNPFAYALANRQFRMAFLKMFKGNFKRSA